MLKSNLSILFFGQLSILSTDKAVFIYMNNMSLHFNVYGEKSEKYRTFFAKIFVGKKSLLMLVIDRKKDRR